MNLYVTSISKILRDMPPLPYPVTPTSAAVGCPSLKNVAWHDVTAKVRSPTEEDFLCAKHNATEAIKAANRACIDQCVAHLTLVNVCLAEIGTDEAEQLRKRIVAFLQSNKLHSTWRAWRSETFEVEHAARGITKTTGDKIASYAVHVCNYAVACAVDAMTEANNALCKVHSDNALTLAMQAVLTPGS